MIPKVSTILELYCFNHRCASATSTSSPTSARRKSALWPPRASKSSSAGCANSASVRTTWRICDWPSWDDTTGFSIVILNFNYKSTITTTSCATSLCVVCWVLLVGTACTFDVQFLKQFGQHHYLTCACFLACRVLGSLGASGVLFGSCPQHYAESHD